MLLKKEQPELTPWGTPVGEVEVSDEPAPQSQGKGLSLDDIVSGGELIMLTVNGPTTYYDYHGHGMGFNICYARSSRNRLVCRYVWRNVRTRLKW